MLISLGLAENPREVRSRHAETLRLGFRRVQGSGHGVSELGFAALGGHSSTFSRVGNDSPKP